jgi:hypothetical protein
MQIKLSMNKKNIIFNSALFRKNFISFVFSQEKSALGTGKEQNEKILAIKKALSENAEREELYSLSNLEKTTSTVSFFEGKVTQETKPCFSLLPNDYYKGFRDSSGIAAGETSEMALNHAIYEFVERQSLVYSFLTERPGVKLDNVIVGGKIFEELKNGEFCINDISIVDGISVVLLIFGKEEGFSVGLGTDKNQKKAAYKAFSEALGYGFHLIKNGKQEKEFLDYMEEGENKADVYSQYMHQFFSKESLFEAYRYLENGKVAQSWKKTLFLSRSVNLFEVSRQLKIPIKVQFLKSNLSESRIKIARVFSEDAYPSINNLEIEPLNYKVSFFENEHPQMINISKYLPFP